VFDRQKPILRVTHDEDDGAWQFLCGDDVHTEPEPVVICLGCISERDSSIFGVARLPLGSCAGRASEADPWDW
jgi:hypothetical protein